MKNEYFFMFIDKNEIKIYKISTIYFLKIITIDKK